MKLVRDRIPDVIRESGEEPRVRKATGEERLTLLREKLLEEVHEFMKTPTEEELADVLEVVYTLRDFSYPNLEETRKRKAEEHGAFHDGTILE